jgi:hypothetical protein
MSYILEVREVKEASTVLVFYREILSNDYIGNHERWELKLCFLDRICDDYKS